MNKIRLLFSEFILTLQCVLSLSVCAQEVNSGKVNFCGNITNIFTTYYGITFQTVDTVFVWPADFSECSTSFFINGYYISDTLLKKLNVKESELVRPKGTKHNEIVSWFVPEYCYAGIRDCYKHLDCFFFTKLPMFINGECHTENQLTMKDNLVKKGVVVSARREKHLFKEDRIILEVK